ncbi:WhiB family transcriptional regulator [Rhodococcus rhodochrous]|uniref:WhiB family transcriptional regulator n=1 Tax=Rhodococcus rhodochrous TaxID=1829 RepID=A0AA46WWR4_RHORH|nr:WhiB family transcriptional regulator [Rhodococcus rhodochrous]
MRRPARVVRRRTRRRPRNPAERRARHAAAIAICRTCPVLETCRVVADEAGRQAHGVWVATVRTTSRPDGRSHEESSHAR